MYKYSCRKCPIRNRCIEESDTSPSAKDMIRNAFIARTDTLATWGVLQKNCLLIKAEEKRARMSSEESLLTRRLREIREAKEQSTHNLTPAAPQPPEYLRPVSPPVPVHTEPLGRDRSLDEPTSPPNSGRLNSAIGRPERKRGTPPNPRWLTVVGSNRHIALPVNGELVLGRFDPHLGVPPDVDLAYEDWEQHTVSRRHAKIVGVEGYHTIEDLGSRNGLAVNNRQLGAGPSELKPGDQLTIGGLQLVYDTVPAYLLTGPSPHDRHLLTITPTGRRIVISPPHEVVIGRSDRYVDFVPDIDLSAEGDVAVRVSRRHAVITWRQKSPYLEDLGSGFGTRLNGDTLLIGQAVALKPGDHIWLGGCVLAYDVEV